MQSQELGLGPDTTVVTLSDASLLLHNPGLTVGACRFDGAYQHCNCAGDDANPCNICGYGGNPRHTMMPHPETCQALVAAAISLQAVECYVGYHTGLFLLHLYSQDLPPAGEPHTPTRGVVHTAMAGLCLLSPGKVQDCLHSVPI